MMLLSLQYCRFGSSSSSSASVLASALALFLTLLLSTTTILSGVNATEEHITNENNARLTSTCAYGFTVCPQAGGSDEGVDFRSHFAVYAAEHQLSGWVRNNCNTCVHGMVASFDNCEAAHTFVAMIQDEARLLVEFDTKAVGLVATVTNITGYPTHPDVMCPHNNGKAALPVGYYADPHRAVVDWSFSTDGCTTPCGCLPTRAPRDCGQTGRLPAHQAPYTLDCQRSPLGADTRHFPDCNSLYTHNDVACFRIQTGNIVSSGWCTNGDGTDYGWVNETAAASCCGPWEEAYTLGRTGVFPFPSEACSVYGPDHRYAEKCDAYVAKTTTTTFANTDTEL